MPRNVDHDERRAGISDALVRLAGREGLHAVTMRSVASEAGVSLRLVQYYFETRAGLMDYTLRRLEEFSDERLEARLSALPRTVSRRGLLEAFMMEALPTNEESRAFHLVWSSFAMISVTDASLAGEPLVEGPDRVERRLCEMIEAAVKSGEMRRDADPRMEAARLVTFAHGLGTSVLVGQRTVEAAEAAISYHLHDLFGSY